jgi:PAS domain S-box-containing protein
LADITERKRAERELRRSRRELAQANSRLAAVMDQMPAGLLLAEAPSGRIIMQNAESARLRGTDQLYSGSVEEYGRHVSIHAEDGRKLAPEEYPLARAVRGETVRQETVRMDTPAGQSWMLSVNAGPVTDGQGRVVAGVVTFQDITGQHQDQRRLERSQARLQAVMDQMPAGLYLAEAPSGKVVVQNAAAAEIMGYSVSADEGMEDYGAYPVWDQEGNPLEPEEYPIARALLAGETTNQARLVTRRAEGSEVVISVNAAPVRDAEGGVAAAVMTFQDVTAEEARKRELAELNRELERRVAERTAELEAKSVSLSEANTALKVLLETRDKEKLEVEEAIQAQMHRLALPIVEKLKTADTPQVRKALLESLEANLKDMTKGFAQKLSSAQYGLSPRELEVASYIKNGKSSDEISDILNLSINSVLFHRANIRKKLGLKGKKQRLAAFLRQME